MLLAHPDRHLFEEARRAVHVEVEPLPAVFSIEDSITRNAPHLGKDNVFKCLTREGRRGHTWAKADDIVEGEYFTGAQEQLYIENQGVIAAANPGTA